MNNPDETLLSTAHELCQDQAFRNAIWRLCAYRADTADISQLSTRISPDDQMLRHLLRYYREVNRSLSQYFSVALQQNIAAQQVLHLLFDDRDDDFSILDFACGYGRLLRFLTLEVPPSQIWASDIQRDAVDFVAREFGVNGGYSGFDPQEFQPGRSFDFIWVASLFSHLPEHLFRAWIARLMSLVKPGGVLCFSVHDEWLSPDGVATSDAGHHFVSTSEIEELDSTAYGTSFVSEPFVRQAILDAGGGRDHSYFRLKRGLANEQDIYVVAKNGDRALDALAGFSRGTWGCVDNLIIYDSGRVYMSGWANTLEGEPLKAVRVTVDGTSFMCPTGVPREDVRATLGEELATSGWEFNLQISSETFVEVSAGSGAAGRTLLYAGPVLPKGTPHPEAAPGNKRTIAQRMGALLERIRG